MKQELMKLSARNAKENKKAYYQIEYRHTGSHIIPDELYSFEVFKTKKDALQWMKNNEYELTDWKIEGYYAGDIEDPSFVNVITGELRTQQ